MTSRVSRTSSQVVVWLRIQSLSENVLRSDVDDMNARSSQKTRASTFRLIFSRASSSKGVALWLTRKHTIPSDAGFKISRIGLARMDSLGPSGQFHPVRHGPPERGHPEGLDRHPDLQGPKRAAQLQAAIRDVRMVRAPYRVLEDVVPHGERALKRAYVLHQQAARLVRLEEPFVRVKPDGIGALDPAQEFLSLLGHHGEAAVRRVDVQPDAFRLAVVRHRFKRIDGPRAARSGVGAHRDGVEPRRAVLGHGACERLHVQAETPVACNPADALRPNANDLGRADLRTVTLVAHVHGRALGMARRFPCRHERVEAGSRPSARQQPTRALRIADPAPDPVDDDQLKLAWAARRQLGALVHLMSGGHEVREHPGPRRRRRDKRDKPGMIVPRRDREDFASGSLENLLRRPAVLRRILHELVCKDLLKIAFPGMCLGQALDALNQKLRRLACEIEHQFGRHTEAVGES